MAMIRNDDRPIGKLNDFELAAAFFLPCDPVAKKKSSKVSSNAHASIAEGAAEIFSTSTSGKPSIGKTGVHLRWHKPNKFAKLSKVQKRELFEWRQSNNEKEGPPNKRQRSSRKDSREEVTKYLMSKLVAKQLVEMKKAEEKEEDKGRELKAQVMAILEEAKTNTNTGASVSSNSTSSVDTSNSLLKGILKKTGVNP